MSHKKCPPAANRGASRTSGREIAAAFNSSLYRRQDGYTAPSADERREGQLLEELRALGYGITVPCLACNRPLSSAVSLSRHLGPVCAARSEAVGK